MSNKLDQICIDHPDMMIMNGFDDCIIGVCYRFGQEPILAYDVSKIIDTLMGDGMSEDEALEYYNFNQIGAWIGDTTPCFVEPLEE